MRTWIATLLVAGTLASMGCARSTYVVTPLLHESVKGRIDGQWFERAIWGKNGELVAVELVYCPTVPNHPTVCRTGVVWEKDHSKLIESVK